MKQDLPYDSRIVANSFLKIALEEGKVLQHMKLQKLVYIAHCWLLFLEEKSLIEDRIEAWEYGPVMPELYHTFKTFGRGPISKYYTIVDYDTGNVRVPFVDKETMEFLNLIWKNYGKYNSIELSALTHTSTIGDKTPWQLAREQSTLHGRGGLKSTGLITSSQIIEHYKKLVELSNAGLK